MITRSLRLRHGRVAIAKPQAPTTSRQWRRTLSLSTRKAAQPSPSDQEAFDKISADWEFYQHQRRLTKKVGAGVEPHYKPQNLIYNPPRPDEITLELLLASQTHLGHRTSLWHPANSRYIHGVWGQAHDAIHVISLDVTAAHLRRACKVVEGVSARGGLVLFVGTRDGQALPVVRAAELAKGYHLFDKWRPGTITNAQQILGKCRKMVVNEMDQEVLGFERQMPPRAALKPDLVVCLNPLENYVLLHECGMHNIPTIGIIDTDVNPTCVTYPIPANDDSIRSVSTIVGALGRAGEAGQARRLKRADEGRIDFTPAANLEMPSIQEVQRAKRLKENPDLEDREEDEEELLSAAEEEMYTQSRQSKELGSATEEEELDQDVPERFEENDDSLVSLTDYATEDGIPQASQEDITTLAQSVDEDLGNIGTMMTADSEIDEQLQEDASAVTSTGQANATRPDAQAAVEKESSSSVKESKQGEQASDSSKKEDKP